MPIRPDLRQFYGRQWREKRAAILKRAHNRCEQCAVPDRSAVERGPAGMWRLLSSQPGTPWRNSKGNITTFDPMPDIRRKVKIVLTVAHLNHTPGDDRDENLAALCQWCHLNYDQKLHVKHSRETRIKRKDAERPILQAEAS